MMRKRLPALVTVIAFGTLLIALAGVEPLAAALEYRRDLLAAEPWRALGAHLTHVNVAHAALNAAAWLIVATMFRDVLSVPRQGALLAAGAAAVIGALYLGLPQVAWYRGASGALHALFFGGASLQLAADPRRPLWPLLLLFGGAAKLWLEGAASTALPWSASIGAPSVPAAHLAGAIAGVAIAAAIAARRRQRR